MIFAFSIKTNIYSQVQFNTHLIFTGSGGGETQSVCAADFDGDGDIDVLSGGISGIYLYENDGNQNFNHINIGAGTDISKVFSIDIDSDDDIDVVFADFGRDLIALLKNDGDSNFTVDTIYVILNDALWADVYAIDFDTDGDIDVISTYSGGTGAGHIVWHENDGNESFTHHTVFSLSARSIYPVDLDGDDDMDVIAAHWQTNNTISWYENDGNENFTWHIIDGGYNLGNSIHAADVDDDGDIDVISGEWQTLPGTFWYENNGAESFTKHSISLTGTSSVYPIDIEGDGDLDVISADFGNKVTIYENDGNQIFTENIIGGGPASQSVYPIDVDGDGDIDVVSAFSNGTQSAIFWHENQTIVGINDSKIQTPTLISLDQNYPNPFNPNTTISYSIPKRTNTKIIILDVLGREITTLVNEDKSPGSYEIRFNASNLSSGIYFYQLKAEQHIISKKMILLR